MTNRLFRTYFYCSIIVVTIGEWTIRSNSTSLYDYLYMYVLLSNM